MIGHRDGEMVRRTIASAEQHHIPIDVLEAPELALRFPAFHPRPDDLGVLEHLAGYLVPEDCVRAHLESATRAGADLHFDEKVLSWSAQPERVEVRTAQGSYVGKHLVITAGPWAGEELHSRFPLRVTRQVTAWIQPKGGIAAVPPSAFSHLHRRGISR